MGDFFKTYKFKLILIMLSMLLGVVLYSASVDGVKNIPQNLLTIMVHPFQKATAYITEQVTTNLDTFFNATSISKENESLKGQIADLNSQLIDYERVKKENEHLKELANIESVSEDIVLMSAFVISRNPNAMYESFVIDKGSIHGVELNDPVITQNGIIGYVSELTAISSLVTTILDPAMDISVYEITTKELGVVSGETSMASNNQTKMSILSNKTEIDVGDIIVSAGATGKFPEGLAVGVVEEVRDENHGMTKYAIIEPVEDISRVSNVQIVIDFLGQGGKLIDYVD